MARKTGRPGRTLAVFFLGLAIAFGLVALGGTWKPSLGLDLEGGTRIQLTAKGDVTPENLAEARKIIDSRVNGSGVSESEVTTQGNRFIVVEIPGGSRSDLVNTVTRQAQLRFRLVACTSVDGRCATQVGGLGGSGVTVPGTTPSVSSGSGEGAGKGSGSGTKGSGKNRPLPGFGLRDSASPSATPSADASASPSADASADPSADPSATASTTVSPQEQQALDACVSAAADDKNTATPLTWMDTPTTACVEAFNTFTCPTDGSASQAMADVSDQPLLTCDDNGVAYLLSPAVVEGTSLSDAAAAIPQGSVNYAVTLSFDGTGTTQFADVSRALVGTEKQFAIVLDGQVISAPTMNGVITDGNAQITGDFTSTEANSLATSLKYGALPISFDEPLVEVIGPSLAGDQLSAGITAGLVGLVLVMLYCLLYYRGLGLVVIGSLVVAAALTYAMVLLLAKGAGFTLTLPGIAGLIVAVGITADSFIVFFERIRDEMREGRSMRVAVEAGWVRARNTCLAADTVSLLAAVVLYIFAAGVVKGFAFALGLSTLIDLAVFFWFTKPSVTLLARLRFFNRGHKLSGLDAEALGVDRITVGGKA